MKKNKFYYFLISGFALAGLTMAGCKEETKDPELPKIGGYNNSNEVAAANLKAHWTFDGTYVEDISKKAETSKDKASFTTGIKGQAVSLDRGYVYYANALGKLKTGQNFTVSSWVQVANNADTINGAMVYFQSAALSKPLFGNLSCMLEGDAFKFSSDTILVKSIYSDGGGTQDNITGGDKGDYIPVTGAGKSKWIQLITTYDSSNPDSNRFQLYANGIKVGNVKYENRRVAKFTFADPNEVIIGGWYNDIPGKPKDGESFTLPFLGKIDEVRVFDKLLSQTEITALYDIELVGR